MGRLGAVPVSVVLVALVAAIAAVAGGCSATSFVWADCTRGTAGASMPVRVRGSLVEAPGDGTSYATDVERLFPGGLAALILESPDQLRGER